MASEVRIKILLECTECKRRNYATEKNKRNTTATGAAAVTPQVSLSTSMSCLSSKTVA